MRFGQILVVLFVLALPLIANAQRDSVTLHFGPSRDTVLTSSSITIGIYPDKALSNVGIDTIQFTLHYLDDLLSYESTNPPGLTIGPRTFSGREVSVPISIIGKNLKLDPSKPIASLRFQAMVTDTTYTQLRLTDLAVNPGDQSYSAVVLGADTGSIYELLKCSDPTLQKFLRGVSMSTIDGILPNPARDEIRVVVASEDEKAQVRGELFDVVGNKSLDDPDVRQTSLYVGDLPSGTYYLRLSLNGYVVTR